MRAGGVFIGALAFGLAAFLPLRPASADLIQKSSQHDDKSITPLDLSRIQIASQPETTASDTEIHPYAGATIPAPMPPAASDPPAIPVSASEPSSGGDPAPVHLTTAQVHPLLLQQQAVGSVPEPSFLGIAGLLGIGLLLYRPRRGFVTGN